MQVFLDNFTAITWQMVVMWVIGGALIYLAIKKDMEPTLLLPMGFGAILINLPFPARRCSAAAAAQRRNSLKKQLKKPRIFRLI